MEITPPDRASNNVYPPRKPSPPLCLVHVALDQQVHRSFRLDDPDRQSGVMDLGVIDEPNALVCREPSSSRRVTHD